MSHRTLYKYQLEYKPGIQYLELPERFAIMSTQLQNGRITFWAAVDTSLPKRSFEFLLTATGEGYPEEHSHLATLQMPDGIVVHVFVSYFNYQQG